MSSDLTPIEEKEPDQFLVVGIGASAGGIQALQEFFKNTRPDSGIAYVVILHLSPDHDSKLAEILRAVTTMEVTQVKEEVTLVPDHVYVIPPNKSLQIAENRIRVNAVETVEERRAPVDIFFRSLADSHGPRAAGVILSGTGANGSMGIKRIKENGGVAFVQSPKEAEFNEMPRNSIATDLIDAILPVTEIPSKIVSYRDGIMKTKFKIRDKDENEVNADALKKIFMQLRLKTGHDFSNYKRATMLRRIGRRMIVRNLAELKAYADLVADDKTEAVALLKDLLISVTNFFRDQQTFTYLDVSIIPQVLAGKGPSDWVRIWVAGCATGEEAYTLAMILSEHLTAVAEPPSVQIFATDLDDHAIAVAREGLYTINDAADVSPERLRRFFTKEGNEYRIRRELREMTLFAGHNLIKDPPFSHLDLASCRNLLIYLNQSAQRRVMETLHFALNPKAFLLLGASESVEGSTDLFVPENKEFHVFQSRAIVAKHFPVPDTFPSPAAQQRMMADPATLQSKSNPAERITFSELHQRLLEEYAPPSLVVNEDFDIVHMSEGATAYLQIVGGEPSNNLLKLVRPELRLELRSALYQAIQHQTNLEIQSVETFKSNSRELVNIRIRPVLQSNDVAQGLILIIFEPVVSPGSDKEKLTVPGPVAEHLEEELVRSKHQLRSSIEQYEVQTEELKASNEELQAMNEELRSGAEELETSKEELQSINEELLTVNQELKVKIEELSQANNNFRNLMNSTDIGTLFLDRALRVNLFTPSVRSIFNLIPNDVGRPLSDISGRLVETNLLADAETVLDTLVSIEREVRTTDDQRLMMRVLPYRTAEDLISGVIVTFVNITRLKLAEDLVLRNDERQRYLLSLNDRLLELTDPRVIVGHTLQTLSSFLSLQSAAYYSLPSIVSSEPFLTIAGVDGSAVYTGEEAGRLLLTLTRNEGPGPGQRGLLPLSSFSQVSVNGNDVVIPLYRDGAVEAIYFLRGRDGSSWLDADLQMARQAGERAWNNIQRVADHVNLQRSEENLRILVDSIKDYAIITLDLQGTITGWNPGAAAMFGYSPEETIGRHFSLIFTPEDRSAGMPEHETAKALADGHADDERWHLKKDGTRIFLSGVTSRMSYGKEGLVKIARDMTANRLLEQQKDQFIGIASHELKTPVTSIKAYAEVLQDMFLDANDHESAELMGKLDSQVDRLTALISHLLDTTQIAEGQLTFHPEVFDVNELISEHLTDLQRVTQKHKIMLHTNPLPPIRADRERIGQVLINLMSNAIKYSPDGGEILLTSESSDDGGVMVKVKDSGIGISADATEKIFDRFFRTMNPKIHTFPGLGLGLYISGEIIKRHHGKIWVESRPGEGSTFYFTLPSNLENNT